VEPDEAFVADRVWTDAMLDAGFSSTVVIDLERVVLQWSHAAEHFYGWRAAEIIGRDFSLVVPFERRSDIADGLAALRMGRDPKPVETIWQAKDGSEVPLRVQLTPFRDVAGRVVGACVFSFDNSDHVRTRAALAASEARYRALVGALTEFVIVVNANGEVEHPQPSWSAYTGQDFAAALGQGWRDALHPDDRQEIALQLGAGAVLAEPFTVAGRVRHESGEYRQCECRLAPMRDTKGRVAEWVGALSDVNDRHIQQLRERHFADRFHRMYGANVFGMAQGEGRTIHDANEAMLEILGRTRRDLAGGIEVPAFVPSDDALDGASLPANGEAREFEIVRADGTTAYVLASAVSLAPNPGWMAVAVDVTARKAAERASEHRALHDPLTGLPNRRLLVDRLAHALSRAARQDTLVGVLFCDLDHFKEVNDAYGHAAGDATLEAVAVRLLGLLREGDTVARAGGDEFVVVLEDLVEEAQAGRIADRVRAALARPVIFDGGELHVTCSIGVAVSAGETDRVEAVLSRADDAMYRAKEQGRDRIVVGTGTASARAERRWVERALQRALDEGAFELAFQPVFDLRDGRPIGAEALLRWTVDGETVPTVRAIAVAEESGMITRVSDWVLQEACTQFSAWRAGQQAAAYWKLHVNVSARDLADEHFVERVLDGIAAGGCEPRDLCLEMTETAMLQDPARAQVRLGALREAGVVVAIDDFGTGYASLGVLRDVPADIVKIDRSFVAELGRSERVRAIVQHAVDLSHELGLVVVGEGVETSAQMAILGEMGCDHAQGFAFARPRPVAELPVEL
jgi:diguanylate cyclase (GGDEF)-like protein/PAS domain S-box-containing protein